MRIALASVVCWFVLVGAASAQQWIMPGMSPRSVDGPVGEFAPRGAGFFCQDRNAGWHVNIAAGKTTIIVNGPGDRSLLKPKMYVQFKVEVDDALAATAPIKEINVFTGTKVATGFLKPPVDHVSKPVTKPTAGKWEVRGLINSIEADTLSLTLGPKKLNFTLDPKIKINASLSDLKYVQQGDVAKIIGWIGKGQGQDPDFKTTPPRPGTVLAEKITITTKNVLVDTEAAKPKKL